MTSASCSSPKPPAPHQCRHRCLFADLSTCSGILDYPLLPRCLSRDMQVVICVLERLAISHHMVKFKANFQTKIRQKMMASMEVE